MKVIFVTRNPGKIAAAEKAFSGSGIELIRPDRDYPEIQADTSVEIARYTAMAAASELGLPAIREDHSLIINALGDRIPGPYMAYFDKRVSANRLLTLLEDSLDREGYFEVATVYAQPDGDTVEYVFQVPITIAHTQRGELQSGWNRVIKLRGDTRTLAEYPETDRSDIWTRNYQKIVAFLTGHTASHFTTSLP